MAADIRHAISDIVYKIQQKVKQEFYIPPPVKKMTSAMCPNYKKTITTGYLYKNVPPACHINFFTDISVRCAFMVSCRCAKMYTFNFDWKASLTPYFVAVH